MFRPIVQPLSPRTIDTGDGFGTWANQELQLLLLQLRRTANALAPVNVELTGAKHDDKQDDSSAILEALDNSQSVYLPAGTYRIDNPLALPSNALIYGAGRGQTTLHATGGNVFTCGNSDNWTIRDLSIQADNGDGVYVLTTTSTNSIAVERVSIKAPAGRGIFLDAVDAAAHYYPRFHDVVMDGDGNPGSIGLKISSNNNPANAICCVGGRFWGGRTNAMHIGVTLDQLDTFSIYGSHFSNGAGAGSRGIVLGNTNQCRSWDNRFEDPDVWVELTGPLTRLPYIDTGGDWPATKLLDGGAQDLFFNAAGSTNYVSTRSSSYRVAGRLIARGSLETPGQSIFLANGDNNNVAIGLTALSKIFGPTAAFALTGVVAPITTDATAIVDGTRVLFWNASGQPCTIRNNVTSTAANRITTGTGADVLLVNHTFELIYETSTSRWLLRV